MYGEKPLAVDRAEAEPLLKLAAANNLRIGCAPDTVLGTGTQTARAAIDRGDIGVPTAATASFVTPGHELWHPAPEFYYQPGGGPLLDMGPYYVTSLVTLLGPVRRVTGRAGRSQEQRKIHTGPRAGETFPVEVPTHVTGVLEHESGALTTVLMSLRRLGRAAAADRGARDRGQPVGAGPERLRRQGGDRHRHEP